MTLCLPCKDEGREQVHHHFKDFEDGRGPVAVCRWHFKGLPYPAGRQVKLAKAESEKEGMMQGKKSSIDEEKLRALHAQGLRDAAIAKALGCSGPTVCQYRHKFGLEAHSRASKVRSNGGAAKSPPQRAALASAGREFHRHRELKRAAHLTKRDVAARASAEIGTNGSGILVPVRLELLDAIWAELEPPEKAQLLNHLIETRKGA